MSECPEKPILSQLLHQLNKSVNSNIYSTYQEWNREFIKFRLFLLPNIYIDSYEVRIAIPLIKNKYIGINTYVLINIDQLR